MPQMKNLPGIKYNAAAGSMADAIQKMIELANKEDSFVYESLNGTLLVVEPGMSADDAMNFLHDIRSGKKKTVFYDTIRDYSSGEAAKNMEALAQDNDIVISNINGTVFRIFKGMSAEEALDTLENVRKMKELRVASQKLQKDKKSAIQLTQHLQNQND